ncbi:phosphatidylinositol-specific phospholipase C/glycerophosphodiester phosphodiesterase family protein [Fictibacillus sp. KIGAM418]|uniref:Altered inheritance of mitochondria protein 6 n=1 Tax=Fictibacillus marinisediminis TaxID=2878389 RepID=A0A9X1XGT5_9BACL|nr:phosphatidylinositol-specific phospholipase C/glycerophosphodiester phosphodiesterase family protein [Fictibacillus marinisediminis]MCK6257384.1 phosphatidylinositol-specific phospholipase C/glycerophosphodiester phosphodiesterase family protein [Fictibacillus marinisediminis]
MSLAVTAVTMSISTISVFAEPEPNDSNTVPLARAHAHNDYEHERPLYDALDHGFTSVEADVWLEDGKLLVAHDEVDVKPDRTLKSLYLEPLKRKITQNQGSVYKDSDQDFLLWIDVKSEDVATYKKIHEQLADYQKMLTKFSKVGVDQRSVTVIISGNRPRELMENQVVRYAAYDGRMSDLETNALNDFMPVISDNWTKQFTWQGIGEMPSEEREKLKYIVKTAHNDGQMVRFWATPDLAAPNRKAVWDELMKADVDLINTDDLPGLQKYLLENDPNPTQQHIKW